MLGSKFKLIFCLVLSFLGTRLNSQPPEFVWAKQLETVSFGHEPYIITKDKLGNIYTSGFFSGTIDFDPGAGVFNMSATNSSLNFFISKLDNNGNFIWAKKIENTLTSYSISIASDDSGNVYMAGTFINMVDFDPGTGTQFLTAAPNNKDVFILKLDGGGNFKWVKQFSGFNAQILVGSILLNAKGEIYITGSLEGNADFDPGPLIYRMNALTAIYFVKLDTQGNFIWGEFIELNNSFGGLNYPIRSEIDKQGNIITHGNFSGWVDFDPDTGYYPLSSISPIRDYFILKFNSDGKFIWVKQISGNGEVSSYNLITDIYSNIYSTSWFVDSIDFDPGVSKNNLIQLGSGSDAFVLKLDSSGNFIWAKQFLGNPNCSGRGLALDSTIGIYVIGVFYGISDFDPGNVKLLTASGSSDVFVLKLNEAGKLIWIQKLGDIGYDITGKIINDSNNIYFSGYYQGKVDFDPADSGVYQLNSSGVRPVIVKWNICNTSYHLKLITCDSFTFNNTTYKTSGKYMQKLINTRGCDSSIFIDLTIAKPRAKFVLQSEVGCQYIAYNFIDSSYTDTVSIMGYNYFWDFGDGTFSNINSSIPVKNFNHIYTKSGTYTVKLIFSNGFCTDTFIVLNDVLIKPAPKPGFTLNSHFGCTPFNLIIRDTSTSDINLKEYDFGNGFIILNNKKALDTIIQISSPGTYVFKQRLTGITGCITRFSDTIIITPGLTKLDTVNVLFTTVLDSFNTFTQWNKLPNAVSYNIRNTAIKDTFFIDFNVQPALQSEKYFISATDSCGNKSATSPVAQTIYLQGENQNFNEFALLQYTPYETWKQGVLRYEIEYKNYIINTWIKIDSMAGNVLNAKTEIFPDSINSNFSTSQICYRIKAIEQNGNQQISISNIVCIPVYPVVFVPNAFSPNGDGLNDYFKPVAAGLNAYIFEIYDRWGTLVYSDSPDSKGWDGTYKGELLPVGSYVYRLSAAGYLVSPSTNAARRVERKGIVYLVR